MVGLEVQKSQTAHAVELSYSIASSLMQLSARETTGRRAILYHGRLRRFNSHVGEASVLCVAMGKIVFERDCSPPRFWLTHYPSSSLCCRS